MCHGSLAQQAGLPTRVDVLGGLYLQYAHVLLGLILGRGRGNHVYTLDVLQAQRVEVSHQVPAREINLVMVQVDQHTALSRHRERVVLEMEGGELWQQVREQLAVLTHGIQVDHEAVVRHPHRPPPRHYLHAVEARGLFLQLEIHALPSRHGHGLAYAAQVFADEAIICARLYLIATHGVRQRHFPCMGILDGGKGKWLAVEVDVPTHLVGLRHGGKVRHPKEYRREKKSVHCAQCQKALPRFGRKGINILYI